ncbi:28 kDa heat- and acid-stable phosphoprotein-like isoform X1 [Montipora capricornis]|uniref:28 kDa heat- and acid-stable phosphoprotein-like isoform X1 n=1 Tax=Montipora foliosa TaxID=591990 RepID=UPI0035F1C7E6
MSRRGGRGKVHHKGKRRHFTDAEELRAEMEKDKREKDWREKKGGQDLSDEGAAAAGKSGSESEEESDSEEEKQAKPKGVSGLIEIENPNRVVQRTKKATELDADDSSKSQLSRREREEIARQRNILRQRKLQEEGKTDQARSDLARLSLIRKQREEAARKREEQKKAKEAAEATKTGNR